MTKPFEVAENQEKLRNFKVSHEKWIQSAGEDGKMNFEEFLRMVLQEYYDVSDEQMNMLRARFDKYDRDGDGIVTIEERASNTAYLK